MLTEEGFKIRIASLRKEEDALTRERERLEREKVLLLACFCELHWVRTYTFAFTGTLFARGEAHPGRRCFALQQSACCADACLQLPVLTPHCCSCRSWADATFCNSCWAVVGSARYTRCGPCT